MIIASAGALIWTEYEKLRLMGPFAAVICSAHYE